MANQELVNWLKKGLMSGYSKTHLKEVLIRHGHSQEQVEEALSAIPERRKRHHPTTIGYVLIAIILFGMVITSAMYYNDLNQEPQVIEADELQTHYENKEIENGRENISPVIYYEKT